MKPFPRLFEVILRQNRSIILEISIYALFLAATLVSICNTSYRDFSLIPFLFVPGYFILRVINKKVFGAIELILLSFGVSILSIIPSAYASVVFNFASLTTIIPALLTTIFFLITLLRGLSNTQVFSENNSNCIWRLMLSLVSESRYSIAVILLTISFFIISFFIRSHDIYRMPDEYYYLWASDNTVLHDLNYRTFPYMTFHPLLSSTLKIGFILILYFNSQVTGSMEVSYQVLTILFYSMLIPVTYLIGKIHAKKTGLIAALLIACNPIVWFWSNRIMPDILYAVIASSCLYFFYFAFKERGTVNRPYLISFILFALISYFIEPKWFFLWSIPFLLYLVTFFVRPKSLLSAKVIIPFLFITALITIAIWYSPWLLSFDLPKIMDGLFSVARFSISDWHTFLTPGPQSPLWNTWAYPYYYTHAISLLAIVGIFYYIFKHSKRESLFLVALILISLYVHCTAFGNQDARFSFLIFPLIILFSAIGLQVNLGLYSLLLTPLIYFISVGLLANEPGVTTFPQLNLIFSVLSKLIVVSVLFYKILEGVLPRIARMRVIEGSSSLKFRISNQVTFLIIILIASTSLVVGESIVTNPSFYYNDNVTPESIGVPQAGYWLVNNTPPNSIIVTNIRAHILSYYTDCSFDIENKDWKISRSGNRTIISPSSEQEFSDIFNTKNYTYLVAFSKPVASEHWKKPFFEPFIEKNSLFTVYESIKEEPILIFSCESTERLSVTRGSMIFTLDSIDKTEGLYSIIAKGSTNERGQTRISYNFETSLSLNKSLLDFRFRIGEASNPNYFSLLLIDSSGNYRFWNNNTSTLSNWNSNNWQKMEISLSTYNGQEGPFDINTVKEIALYIYADPNSSITYQIDEFRILTDIQKVYSLPAL